MPTCTICKALVPGMPCPNKEKHKMLNHQAELRKSLAPMNPDNFKLFELAQKLDTAYKKIKERNNLKDLPFDKRFI